MKQTVGWRMMSVAVMFTAVMATVVHAQQPTVVFSIRGIEPLLEDAEFIGAEVGQENVKDSAEALIGAFTQGKGLAGIDQTKPLGIYVNMTAAGQPTPVAFVPVSDADALQELVSSYVDDLKVAKGQWTGTASGTKMYGKVTSGYLFVSTDQNAVAKPADPTKIVSGKYDIALDISLASIPEAFKKQFLDGAEIGGRAALDAGPEPKNEAERVGRDFGFNGTIAVFKALANDGDKLTLGIDIDAEKRLGAFDFVITGKANSELAKTFTAFGKTQPLFSGLGTDSSPLRVVISYPTTGIVEPLSSVFDAIRSAANSEIDKDEKLKTDADRKTAKGAASRIFDIAQATIKSGSMHSGLVLEAAGDGKIRFIGGTQLAKGDEVGKLLDEMSKAPQFDKLKIDVAKHGGARIHSITPDNDDDAEKYLGDEPFHLAIRPDSAWISGGGGNLTSLKKALDQSAKPATRTPSSPISIRIKPAALVLLMEKNDEDLIERAKAVAELPGDKVNIELGSIPNGAKLRIDFGIDLLKLAENGDE